MSGLVGNHIVGFSHKAAQMFPAMTDLQDRLEVLLLLSSALHKIVIQYDDAIRYNCLTDTAS